MPKDNIEAAIKRAAGKDVENFTEIVYEGKGPHGVLVFVECATDNTTRTVANIKSYFNKLGGSLVPTGSLEFMFSRRAAFEFEKPDNFSLDEIELQLIESGLEEIEAYEDTIYITGDYTNFGVLSQALADLGFDVKKASLKRVAHNPVEFTEEQLAEIDVLIDRIDDDDDVQAVYTNIA
jgi:YebC/PmpR family DNA-binding regulatory protein